MASPSAVSISSIKIEAGMEEADDEEDEADHQQDAYFMKRISDLPDKRQGTSRPAHVQSLFGGSMRLFLVSGWHDGWALQHKGVGVVWILRLFLGYAAVIKNGKLGGYVTNILSFTTLLKIYICFLLKRLVWKRQTAKRMMRTTNKLHIFIKRIIDLLDNGRTLLKHQHCRLLRKCLLQKKQC